VWADGSGPSAYKPTADDSDPPRPSGANNPEAPAEGAGEVSDNAGASTTVSDVGLVGETEYYESSSLADTISLN